MKRSFGLQSPLFALLCIAEGLLLDLDSRHSGHVTGGDGDGLAAGLKEPSKSTEIFMDATDLKSQTGAFLEFLKKNLDIADSPDRKSFKSCAVVGRSPISLKSNNGKEIDRHDAIFRSGICAPAPEQIADLGSNLGFCVSFLANHDGGKQIILQSRLLEMHHFLEDPHFKNYHINHGRVLVPKQSFFEEVDRSLEVWGGLNDVEYWRTNSELYKLDCFQNKTTCTQIVDLSSGFYAVALAKKLCSSIDVYGFDQTLHPKAKYEHLDEPGVALDNGRVLVEDHPHPFALERTILRAWHDNSLIRLVPSPNAK
jgi:hypothetical protein